MINLSYLSKLKINLLIFLVIFIIGYITKFFVDGFSVVDTVLLVIYLGGAFNINFNFASLKKCMVKSVNVLNDAVKGNLESRANKYYRQWRGRTNLPYKINNLLDQGENIHERDE